MPSITAVPPSTIILIDRIAYWEKQLTLSTCPEYLQTCEMIIFELESIKDQAKGT